MPSADVIHDILCPSSPTNHPSSLTYQAALHPNGGVHDRHNQLSFTGLFFARKVSSHPPMFQGSVLKKNIRGKRQRRKRVSLSKCEEEEEGSKRVMYSREQVNFARKRIAEGTNTKWIWG